MRKRQRAIIFDPEVHAYLDCWQGRDREFSKTGNAPISATVNELVRGSEAFQHWMETGQLPPLGTDAKGGGE